jgi:hypothetical protein
MDKDLMLEQRLTQYRRLWKTLLTLETHCSQLQGFAPSTQAARQPRVIYQ